MLKNVMISLVTIFATIGLIILFWFFTLDEIEMDPKNTETTNEQEVIEEEPEIVEAETELKEVSVNEEGYRSNLKIVSVN